jgi:hypothetical protein
LAIRAGRDICVFKISAHIRPVVVISDVHIRFVSPKVAQGVMGQAKQVFPQGAKSGYDQSLSQIPQSIVRTNVRYARLGRRQFSTEIVMFVSFTDTIKE